MITLKIEKADNIKVNITKIVWDFDFMTVLGWVSGEYIVCVVDQIYLNKLKSYKMCAQRNNSGSWSLAFVYLKKTTILTKENVFGHVV